MCVVQEVLQEQPGVWWMDSSVRLRGQPSSSYDAIMDHVYSLGGIMYPSTDKHTTFAVTEKTMYEYLPTDLTEMKKRLHIQATTMIIFRTQQVWENLLKWAILCSLNEKCIAPTYKNDCEFKPMFRGFLTTYANCHRFDQSMSNILLLNWHNFRLEDVRPKTNITDIRRHVTHRYLIQNCTIAKTGKDVTDRQYKN